MMTDSELDYVAYKIAYNFYHNILRRNNTAKLNSEQMDNDASETAAANKHLFYEIARMELDIKTLIPYIDIDDPAFNHEDKVSINHIKSKYN